MLYYDLINEANINCSKNKITDKHKMSKEAKDKDNNEKLIKIAVQFLLNPKIENAPDETKKAFLKKKGSAFSFCQYQCLS